MTAARPPRLVTLEVAVDAVRELLHAHGGEVAVDGDTSLEELGLDSLDMSELLVALETRLGVALDAANATEVRYVRDLMRLCPLEPAVP